MRFGLPDLGIDPTDCVVGGYAPDTPERRLLRAVLEDAILCVRSKPVPYASPDGDCCRTTLVREATVRWFQTRGDERLFSFESICFHLGLPAERVRRAVLHGTARPLRKRPRMVTSRASCSGQPLVHGGARTSGAY